jgi:hypothetical protein
MSPSDTAMTPAELRAALQFAVSTFFKYQAMGKFDQWELTPRIGPRRYSRKAVQAYLDRDGASGEPARGFGRRRSAAG